IARCRDRWRAEADGLFRLQHTGIERQPPDQDQADQIDRVGLRRRRRPLQETLGLSWRAFFVFHGVVLLETFKERKAKSASRTRPVAFSSESLPRTLIAGWITVRVKKTRQNL